MMADSALALQEPLPEEEVDSREIQESLNGPERAAVLLLSLGNEYGLDMWEQLDDDEIKEISFAMSKLGRISVDMVEQLLVDFVSQMSSTGALTGNYSSTARLLEKFLPGERVSSIMEEIRGPAGRNMWEKLSNVQEGILANYLKNEYPQTVAVVLSKVNPDHAANILAILPEQFALEVVGRMLGMGSVQREILDKVENTLRSEFMSSLSQTTRRDAHQMMADIFNNFDRQTEGRFLTAMEKGDREAAERIKGLMFTFEDLSKLDSASAQTLLRHVDKDKLALAMKGASDIMRDFFFANMSERASKMLREDIEVLGPVRLKDADEAQTAIVNMAKDLSAQGELMISKSKTEDELIY